MRERLDKQGNDFWLHTIMVHVQDNLKIPIVKASVMISFVKQEW